MSLPRRATALLAPLFALVAWPLAAGAATPTPFAAGNYHVTLTWLSTNGGVRVRTRVGTSTLSLVMASDVVKSSLHGVALDGKYTSSLGLNAAGSVVDDFTLRGTWDHEVARGSAKWIVNGNTLAGHATLDLVIGRTTVSARTTPSTNGHTMRGVVVVRT